MTEGKWLLNTDPINMIKGLEQRGFDLPRRRRLFGCACCRRVWPLLQWEVARRAVELSEAFSYGKVTEAEFLAHGKALDFADIEDQLAGTAHTQLSACVVGAIASARCLLSLHVQLLYVVMSTSTDVSRDYMPNPRCNEVLGRTVGFDHAELAVKANLLRDVFGNPYRAVKFNPAWRTTAVLSIARTMHENREFSEMPSLGDGLRAAGCDYDAILSHCRSGPHALGCWVVDLVLGKM